MDNILVEINQSAAEYNRKYKRRPKVLFLGDREYHALYHGKGGPDKNGVKWLEEQMLIEVVFLEEFSSCLEFGGDLCTLK